ncbi:MAG: DEAD/DEAH box helicase family protein [Pirellulales bacterium]|nr:DEAD/DEAH box helicase family protein [Pirellulales bacterium]
MAQYSINQLIINSPYEEPTSYWAYHRATRFFTKNEGRRPAGYVTATPGSKAFDDPGVFRELPLVNKIRPRVKAWREGGYLGVTGITKRLLEHWRDLEERDFRRFFFCQLEAIETLIWLAEAPPAEKQGIVIPGDGGPFTRLCSKMATGSGKTIVMTMLIAWHVLNKVTYPQDARFAKNILVVAPGLTVRNRLSVLVPDSPGNYYDEFNIVPPGLVDQLRQGRVLVRNWHALGWDTEEQIAKRKSVDKRGAKSDEAYVREVLGEMASARNILVINDEAHHAWRVPVESKVKGVSKADIEEATKWIGALDRIHRSRGILTCHDFSATPFVPSGKKSTEEALFDWIVSDFGLNDAIESGLVKTPRVVIRDDGQYGPDYKSRLYHIYNDPDVKDDLNRKAEEQEPLPDLVTNGYYLLGKDWLETAKKWESAGHKTPPVMITVANITHTAARVKYAFDRGRIRIDELRSPERTLHIDSKVLDKAESQSEAAEINGQNGEEENEEAPVPIKKLTKDQQAERLRQMVDTVGRFGEPGGPIQNVISVGMLSEGWDAKTVTHIMGLRAFSSQLLCEQVVGRGLRRTSYEVNRETGLFEPEYVNIFGVPFTFLPHEGGEGPPPPPPPPKTQIEPVAEKRQFEITWPNVVRIDHAYTPVLKLDLEHVSPLHIDASRNQTLAELAPIIEGKPDVTRLAEIDLTELGRKFRMQKIAFEAAAEIFDLMKPSWKGQREYLLAQIIGLVEKFLRSNRLQISPPLFFQNELRRRIILTLNMTQVVQHVWEAIRQENTEKLVPVFDSQRPLRSTADMRPWYTGRPCEWTKRSHINFCVYDSTWEASESFTLDHDSHIDAWVKNDHLGYEILYVYKGVVRKYRPDFLIRLTNGKMLVLEVKGEDNQQNETKRRFLDEWCQAINEQGGFGNWIWDVSRHPSDIKDILLKNGNENRNNP